MTRTGPRDEQGRTVPVVTLTKYEGILAGAEAQLKLRAVGLRGTLLREDAATLSGLADGLAELRTLIRRSWS